MFIGLKQKSDSATVKSKMVRSNLLAGLLMGWNLSNIIWKISAMKSENTSCSSEILAEVYF